MKSCAVITKRFRTRKKRSLGWKYLEDWWPLPLLQWTPYFGENFRGLVLGGMGTYDSESKLIFSDFSRSTRSHSFAPLQNQIFTPFFVKLFCIFSSNFIIFDIFKSFANFESISSVFEQILMKFCRNFTGLKNYSQNFGEISNFNELGVRGLPKKLK